MVDVSEYWSGIQMPFQISQVWMDTRYIISFGIEEQLKIVVQNTHEVTQRPHPHIAAASCEPDSTRKWSHNKPFECSMIGIVHYSDPINRLHFDWNYDLSSCREHTKGTLEALKECKSQIEAEIAEAKIRFEDDILKIGAKAENPHRVRIKKELNRRIFL